MSFELSTLAKTAARYINNTDKHLFLTGKAGTGKTTFLKHIVKHTHKKALVAAPTGIAALNAEGVTLHSLLQLPFGTFLPERIPPPGANTQVTTLFNLFSNLRFNTSKRNLIRETELLIIDEVSMLRADMLDCIDHMLRYLRKNRHQVFGGLQLLFIGDLLQLPPVVKDEEWSLLKPYYASSYFFEALALKDQPPIHIELDKIYRQSDDEFIKLLNRFRENEQTEADIDFLNGYYKADSSALSNQGYIHLTTHNRKADEINSQRLTELSSKTFSYTASIENDFAENLYPTSPQLKLKEGAQVMFIKNDPSGEGKFFNGKIGHIARLGDATIKVKFENGDEVEAGKYRWENKRYTLNKDTNEIEEKILGSFEQYPLKLAWAVTIHKSQGLTFEKAILDLQGAFTQGQVYVALSRLTSLNGLVLSSKMPHDGFNLSPSMKAFSETRASLDQLSSTFEADRKEYLIRLATSTFDFSGLTDDLKAHEYSFNKQENRSLKQQYLTWTTEQFAAVIALKGVGASFIKQLRKIAEQPAYLPEFHERIAKAAGYFTPILQKLLDELHKHDKNLKDKTKLKTYRKELKALEQSTTNKIRSLDKVSLFVAFSSQNKELTRQDLKPVSPPKKEKSKDKTPTAEISFNLFKAGKSIEEIAVERGFVPGTIESHLSQYVERGELDAAELMDEQKLKNILSLINENTAGAGEIKAQLGDEYTWGEVRIAMAHFKFLQKK